jgi:hypothetical protein
LIGAGGVERMLVKRVALLFVSLRGVIVERLPAPLFENTTFSAITLSSLSLTLS